MSYNVCVYICFIIGDHGEKGDPGVPGVCLCSLTFKKIVYSENSLLMTSQVIFFFS